MLSYPLTKTVGQHPPSVTIVGKERRTVAIYWNPLKRLIWYSFHFEIDHSEVALCLERVY
jgi:hypothetical protein